MAESAPAVISKGNRSHEPGEGPSGPSQCDLVRVPNIARGPAWAHSGHKARVRKTARPRSQGQRQVAGGTAVPCAPHRFRPADALTSWIVLFTLLFAA